MSEIKMLPLPEPGLVQSEAEFIYAYDREDVEAYARANVEHHTAAKDAEIEALRAEREVIGAEAVKYADKSGRLEARAERLVEALRLAEEHINTLAPEWYSAGQRVLAEIRAALRDHDQEGK